MSTIGKALIVGNNDYPTCPLFGCEADANEVASILSQNEDGSPNMDTICHTNISTTGELRDAVKELFRTEESISVFYFSGHGCVDPDTKETFLVTPDFNGSNLGLPMSTVLKIANDSKAKNKVILLDCCYSGAFGSAESFNGSRISSVCSGTTVLAASRADESSIEEDGHGIFTQLLCRGLSGGAADISGSVTPGGLYAYVDRSLTRWEPRPTFLANIDGFVSLRKTQPRIDPLILRKIIYYFENPNYSFKLDPSFEWTNDPKIEHEVKQPYADQKNTQIFNDLQRMRGADLVEPIGEKDMYFAAMKSKECKLTPIGKHYWSLVKNGRI